MNEAKVKAVWESYFEADFRHRYFLMLKHRYQRRLKFIGYLVAFLSCGPLVNIFWESGFGDVGAGITGAAAGLLGVYLGASGLGRSLSTAIQAANAWGNASTSLRNAWVRASDGEDVWTEVQNIALGLEPIDSVTTQDLEQDQELVDKAWKESEMALAA